MRDIPVKDQIPQTRDGILLFIAHLKKDMNQRNALLEIAEGRLEIMELELGIRKKSTTLK